MIDVESHETTVWLDQSQFMMIPSLSSDTANQSMSYQSHCEWVKYPDYLVRLCSACTIYLFFIVRSIYIILFMEYLWTRQGIKSNLILRSRPILWPRCCRTYKFHRPADDLLLERCSYEPTKEHTYFCFTLLHIPDTSRYCGIPHLSGNGCTSHGAAGPQLSASGNCLV